MKITLKKLKPAGMLQNGDIVALDQLGDCVVVAIPSNSTITAKDTSGQYYTLTGLSLPGTLGHLNTEVARFL